jgi:hypothetical protein
LQVRKPPARLALRGVHKPSLGLQQPSNPEQLGPAPAHWLLELAPNSLL